MIPPGEKRFKLRAPSIPVYRCLDSQQRSRFHVEQTHGKAMNYLVRARKEIICKVRFLRFGRKRPQKVLIPEWLKLYARLTGQK
jgi:hypothetical protein